MPRRARKREALDIYHVICRGIGKQILFEEEADCRYYLELLQQAKESFPCEIYAYCLMENHIHLLLYIPRDLDRFVKSVSGRYAMYFNRKYDRIGPVFGDRYRSEAVEDDSYLLTVYRYILREPEKAGIGKASEYRWSSYALYGEKESFVDTGFLEGYVKDRAEHAAWIAEENDDECLEYMPLKHDDAWALKVIRRQLGGQSGTTLQGMERDERDQALRRLKKAGMTIRQIERLTGISRGIVQRA